MAQQGELRVVVAEDEPIILDYICKKLREMDEGVRVEQAVETGSAALLCLKQNQPDILFTDIEMPGMNGLDLIRESRKLYPDLFIVVLSGYSNFSYAQTALRYGVYDYLLKPIEPEDLRLTVQRIREERGKQQQLEHIRQERAEYPGDEAPKVPVEGKVVAEQIEQYITTYYSKPLQISDLAEHFNYSATYINRVFKKKYDVAPIQYQMQVRIDKAKTLFHNFRDIDIKDVASAVGYDDARYFSRVFRQAVGQTPSEYITGIK